MKSMGVDGPFFAEGLGHKDISAMILIAYRMHAWWVLPMFLPLSHLTWRQVSEDGLRLWLPLYQGGCVASWPTEPELIPAQVTE